MLLAAVVALVGLAAVLVVVYREMPRHDGYRGEPPQDDLPPAEAVRGRRFRRVWRGYDPPAVEGHLGAVADAYAALLAEAPTDAIARAQRRLRAAGNAAEGTPASEAVVEGEPDSDATAESASGSDTGTPGTSSSDRTAEGPATEEAPAGRAAAEGAPPPEGLDQQDRGPVSDQRSPHGARSADH